MMCHVYPRRVQHCGVEVDDVPGGEEDESVWAFVLLHQVLEGVGFIYKGSRSNFVEQNNGLKSAAGMYGCHIFCLSHFFCPSQTGCLSPINS